MKKTNWEKELDKFWEELCEEPEFARYNKNPIKKFIRQLLAKEKLELIERVRMKKLKIETYLGGIVMLATGYNEAIDELNTKLDQLKKEMGVL